ncbi:MAG: ABC transporter substrate-binding protein [Deinococcales bacterium]
MKGPFHKLIHTPLSRRQFLRYSAATGFTTILASNGLSPLRAQGTQGGTLVLLGHQEVAGLGPNDIAPTVQATVIYNILNPLFIVNHLIELEPILAESYTVSEDGLTYTFNLREGVKFHDGSEMTAEDVKYTFEFYGNADNGSTIANYFLNMASVEVLSPYSLQVNMSAINAAFLTNAGTVPIVPAKYHSEVGEDVFRTSPIGTGAFKLKGWRAAEFTELVAFADHFRGTPKLDGVRLEVVPEPSVRYVALITGEAHSAVWPLLVEDSLSLDGDPNYRVIRTLANSVKHIPINNSLPQLSDKRVRQAMMYALDRQRIIDDLWNGTAEIAHSNLTPKNAYYYNPNLKRYEFNPAEARRLLDEAGWLEGSDGIRSKDGLKLGFTCTTITGDQARRPIAELSQIMLKDVGIDMQLAEAPVASILAGMREGTMDASLFNWTYGSTPEPDPSVSLRSDGGNNFSQYRNPEMDALIDQGLATVNPEERRSIYHKIQEIFVEDVPCLYLQFDQWINVFSSKVGGLPEEVLSPDPVYWLAHQFDLNG